MRMKEVKIFKYKLNNSKKTLISNKYIENTFCLKCQVQRMLVYL